MRIVYCWTMFAFACCWAPEEYEVPQTNVAAYLGPTVIATDPEPNRFGIPLDYPIRITFSEMINRDTVFGAISVRGNTGAVPIEITTAPDERTLRILGRWPKSERLEVTLTAALRSRRDIALRDADPNDSQPATPVRLSFMTGTAFMADAPTVVSTDPPVNVGDASPRIEPVLRFSKRMAPSPTTTAWGGFGGSWVAHQLRWEDDMTALRLIPEAPLRFGSAYLIELRGASDAWGNAIQTPFVLRFATQEAEGHVVINEIVTAPRQDWNDSAGGNGMAFDPVPGNGSVTTSDEYIEIFNGSFKTLDLTGWTLEQIDTTPQTHTLGTGSSVTERFSKATSSLQRFEPGCYLVIGNPVGDNADTITLVLRDSRGFEVDRVTLGVPGGAPPGASTAVTDEAVIRLPNGRDTDIDAADWYRGPASPLAAN